MDNKYDTDFISSSKSSQQKTISQSGTVNSSKNKNRIAKKKRKKNNSVRNALLIVLAAVIILAVSYLVANFDSLSFGKTEGNVVGVSGGNDDNLDNMEEKNSGFPVSFVTGTIKQVQATQSNIFVLTGGLLTCLDRSGSEVYSTLISFVDPIIKAGNGYCITFDRDGCEYILFGKRGEIVRGKTVDEGQILTAALGKNGTFAISSRKTGCTSMITLYDKKATVKFQWLCADEHIIAMAIADSGTSFAAVGINSKQGSVYTHAYYFDIGKKENNKDFVIDSNAAMDIFFSSGSEMITVCQGARVSYNFKAEKAEPVKLDYDGPILWAASDNNANTAVVTKKVDSMDSYQLAVYGKNNTLEYSIQIDDNIVALACSNGSVYILGKDKVYIYGKSGKLKKTLDTQSVFTGIAVGDGRIYSFTQSSLQYIGK